MAACIASSDSKRRWTAATYGRSIPLSISSLDLTHLISAAGRLRQRFDERPATVQASSKSPSTLIILGDLGLVPDEILELKSKAPSSNLPAASGTSGGSSAPHQRPHESSQGVIGDGVDMDPGGEHRHHGHVPGRDLVPPALEATHLVPGGHGVFE